MRRETLSPETIARRRKIAEALLGTPEGRELLGATRTMLSWPVETRRVGVSAEGSVIVRALAPPPPGEPSPGERLRGAGRAAERRAVDLGMREGDWAAVAMIVSSTAASGWICLRCLGDLGCETKPIGGVGPVTCRECGATVARRLAACASESAVRDAREEEVREMPKVTVVTDVAVNEDAQIVLKTRVVGVDEWDTIIPRAESLKIARAVLTAREPESEGEKTA